MQTTITLTDIRNEVRRRLDALAVDDNTAFDPIAATVDSKDLAARIDLVGWIARFGRKAKVAVALAEDVDPWAVPPDLRALIGVDPLADLVARTQPAG